MLDSIFKKVETGVVIGRPREYLEAIHPNIERVRIPGKSKDKTRKSSLSTKGI